MHYETVKSYTKLFYYLKVKVLISEKENYRKNTPTKVFSKITVLNKFQSQINTSGGGLN